MDYLIAHFDEYIYRLAGVSEKGKLEGAMLSLSLNAD
jgi:hypothetical protein